MRALFIILFGLINLNVAFAATPEEMHEIAKMVENPAIPALHRKQYVTEEGVYNGSQAIFLCGEYRYTVYYSGVRPAGPSQVEWMSFWVKKVGSYRGEFETFTDYEVDGSVDYGLDDKKQRVLVPNGSFATGDEHKPMWQNIMDKTVHTLLKCHGARL